MKTLAFFLCLIVCSIAKESKKTEKRGLQDDWIPLNYGSQFLKSNSFDNGLSWETSKNYGSQFLKSNSFDNGLSWETSELIPLEYSPTVYSPHFPHSRRLKSDFKISSLEPLQLIDLGESVRTVITKTVRVPHPVPVPVPVERAVPVPVDRPVPVPVDRPVHVAVDRPVPVHHRVEVPVDRPVPVHVPQPYPVTVERQVPVPVEKPVPVPVKVPYRVNVPVPYKVGVPQPYPVEVPKPVPVPQPIIYKEQVPVPQPVIVREQVPVQQTVVVKQQEEQPVLLREEQQLGVAGPYLVREQPTHTGVIFREDLNQGGALDQQHFVQEQEHNFHQRQESLEQINQQHYQHHY